MKSKPVTVNRALVGAIGGGLLLMAGLLWALGLEGSQDAWRGACMKVGIVMCALWLALPSMTSQHELGRISAGTLGAGLAVAVLVARTKISLSVLGPAVLSVAYLMRVLGPSQQNRPPRP